MSRVVRQSKYRHVWGNLYKKEDCYDDLRPTRSAWDTNFVACSTMFLSVIYEAGGGGAVAVLPWETKGKIHPNTPLITGHKGAVLDIDFSPFNDSLLATVSEDCTGKIWGIPQGGLKENMTEPLQVLNGHKRKVGTVKFNPVANNILATTSTDFAVKIWDIEKGNAVLSVEAQHADIVQSLDWNYNGSLCATSCKDKKVRIVDTRQNKVVSEVEAHVGSKGSRVIFLGKHTNLFSVGFTKNSEREYCLWDPREFTKPLVRTNIDSSSGSIMPFFDSDTSVLFLAGKGDGNIRYYEIVDEDPYMHFLSEFKSQTPQRGMAMIPKRFVNVSECEITRMIKLGTKTAEPISFQVPRKSDIFQDDLYPDTFSGDYSLSSAEWFAGKNADPKLTSLAPGFIQKPKSADFNPDKVEDAKPLSEKELRDTNDKLEKRVAYLEAELVKRDARIKEIENPQ